MDGGRLGALSIPTVPEWMWLRGATEEDRSIALHRFSRGLFLKKTVAFIYMLPPGGKTPFVASARKAISSSIETATGKRWCLKPQCWPGRQGARMTGTRPSSPRECDASG